MEHHCVRCKVSEMAIWEIIDTSIELVARKPQTWLDSGMLVK